MKMCEHALVCAAQDCCGYGEPHETQKEKAICAYAKKYFRSGEIILVEVNYGKKKIDNSK